MFGAQLVDCLGRVRRPGLFRGGVSLRIGSEVPNPSRLTSFFLLLSGGSDVSSPLLLQNHACLTDTMLLAIMITLTL